MLQCLKLTYYAQVQELWSECCTIYIQVCMNKLILVVDNFRETVLLEYIYELYTSIQLKTYHTMTVLLEYINHLL